MVEDEMVKEEHIYHPYLKEEFTTVQKYEYKDKIVEKQIFEMLDS